MMIPESALHRISLLISVVVLLAVFVACIIYASPAEDATILYTYSNSLATKGVISYHPSLAPAEGATDFLWMAALAAFRTIGIDPFVGSLLLSALAALGMLALWQRAASEPLRRSPWFFPLLLAALLGTPFLYAALRGFTPVAFSALIIASLFLLAKDRPIHAAIVAAVATLVRPDAVVYLALPAIYWIAKKCDGRQAAALVLVFALPVAAYWLWRANYFGLFFPLPFYVKADTERVFGVFAKESLHDIKLAIAAIVPLLAASLWYRMPFVRSRVKSEEVEGAERAETVSWQTPLFTMALLSAGSSLLFYAAMKNWMNVGLRFEAPAFYLALLAAVVYCRKVHLIAVGLAFSAFVLRQHTAMTATDLALSEAEIPATVARGLKEIGEGKILLTEAGRLTYYSGWIAYDAWGLNTPEFATRKLRPDDVDRIQPDLIVVHHSDYDYRCLETNEPPTYEKGEVGSTFKAVWQAVKDENPEVWFVSNQWKASECRSPFSQFVRDRLIQDPAQWEHDYAAYIVPATSRFREELRQLIESNGGLRWPQYKAKMEALKGKVGGAP